MSKLQELHEKAENLRKSEDISLIEAIIEICEEEDYDHDLMAKFISGSLKDRLKDEATDRNIIKSDKTQSTLW